MKALVSKGITEVETPGKSQENHYDEEWFKDSATTPEVCQSGGPSLSFFSSLQSSKSGVNGKYI